MQALLEELSGHADPWRGLRTWAEDNRVTEAALCGWERLAKLGSLHGDERYAFLVACLLVGEAVQSGSSAVPLGAAPAFPALMAHVESVGLDVDRDRLPRGLVGLLERCATAPEKERVLGREEEGRPLVVDLDALYFHYLRSAESRVARDIRALLDRSTPEMWSADDMAAALSAVLDERPLKAGDKAFELAGGQVQAVAHAVSSSFLILTGGPGTGKTSVVTSMLRAFAYLGVPPEDILLAAPTGRAANRMKESLEANLASLDERHPSDDALAARLPSARTLHRLLGYRWNQQTFKVNRDSPLAARVLVVDEVSMVSLPLMEALLSAIPRDEPFTLVLVGDAHQLPSVETGDVLRELTHGEQGLGASGRVRLQSMVDAMNDGGSRERLAATLHQPAVPDASLAAQTVWLREVYRQASDAGGQHVAGVAEAIRSATGGAAPVLDVTPREVADGVTFSGVELFDWTAAEGGLDPLLARYAEAFLDDEEWRDELEDGFEPSSERLVAYVRERGRTRVLCFTHKGVAGEEAINAALSKRLDPTRPPSSFAFAGAPVLVAENDNGVGLFNGDQGVVVGVRAPGRKPHLEAAFLSGDGVTLVPLGRLPKAKLCYAMTVHKSQGSEYESVVLVLPEEESRLLVRETVYTGLTRGKRGALVAGSAAQLGAAAAKRTARTSRLRLRVGDEDRVMSSQAAIKRRAPKHPATP